MASSEQDVGLDFHRAFQAIDTDHSGEITVEELQSYCRKMNYQESFVKKWLTLFDEDQNGRITYQEYCNALGVVPKQEVVAKHKAQQKTKKAPSGKAAKGKAARGEKTASSKRRSKEPEETPEAIETPVAETISQASASTAATAPAAAAAADAPTAPLLPPQKPPPRQRKRNQAINSGCLMHHSRARMFQRKALYRLAKKSATDQLAKPAKTRDQAKPPQAIIEKPIGGDKNGGTRRVATRRTPKSLPTEVKPRRLQRRSKRCFSQHKRHLRASIKPGVVLILLAGRHRGKRVVFIKQLASGLLLVTGPFRINGCPLRRVSHSYVIATRTRLDLGDGFQVPERVNDLYFRRTKRLTKKLSAAADPFASQPEAYQLTQERREDQKLVDAQVMSAICSRDDKSLMFRYLRSLFCLKTGQKPHEMVF